MTERSDLTARLAILAGALVITAVSFAVIAEVFGRLPYPLFALWLHMSRAEKIVAAAAYFFSLFAVRSSLTKSRRRRTSARSGARLT